MQIFRLFLAALAALVLAGCGGGSGGGTPFGGTPGNGGGTGGGGGGGGSAPTYSLSVTLSAITVTGAAPVTVTAQLSASDGSSISGQVVSFSTGNGLGRFSAPSALTNAAGAASVTLLPSAGSASGADTVIAKATIGGNEVSGSTGFQLTATDVSIASFVADVGTAALPAYGQTQLTVTLAGTTPTQPVTVSLSSGCASQTRAILTPTTVTTTTGTATFTYRDNGCGAFSPTDNLQASVSGSTVTSARSVTLTAPTVTSVAFVSASPQVIFLRGSGLVETSNITFQVRDTNGAGVPNQEVTLEATSLAGGLTLDSGAAPVVKRSDSAGNVIARINSGTVPTPVRVRATLTATGATTLSSNLSVAVGLPSQQAFSLSQGTLNVEGYNVDGVANTYSIIASDRLGNPVPDGTAINFVTEGGQIQPILFTRVGDDGLSRAVANFQSSSPRPRDGRISVLAYALGEESFLDTNGDNVYSAGEDYQDLGDVFIDRLFNQSFNVAEDQSISLSSSGGSAACSNATSPLIQIGPDAPSRSVSVDGTPIATCVAGWGRAYVRRAVQTVLSTSSARLGWRGAIPSSAYQRGAGSCFGNDIATLIDYIGAPSAPYGPDDSQRTVQFFPLGHPNTVFVFSSRSGAIPFLVADANPVALNPMPAGSTIKADSSTPGLTVRLLGGTVPSTLAPTAASVGVTFDPSAVSGAEGVVSIEVTSPRGLTSIFLVNVKYSPMPTELPCQ